MVGNLSPCGYPTNRTRIRRFFGENSSENRGRQTPSNLQRVPTKAHKTRCSIKHFSLGRQLSHFTFLSTSFTSLEVLAPRPANRWRHTSVRGNPSGYLPINEGGFVDGGGDGLRPLPSHRFRLTSRTFLTSRGVSTPTRREVAPRVTS